MDDIPVSKLDRDTSRVQLVEADPDIQEYGHVTADLLERRLKSHVLLGDTVLIGGTHVLKSDLTYRVLQRNAPLLREGVVVPTTSTAHDGWEDMIDRKLRKPRQYGPMWTSNGEYSTDKNALYQRVSALKGSDKRLIRDIDHMRNIYSGDLETELADPKSSLYHNISRYTNPRDLRKAIRDTEHSSRKFVADRAPGPVRNQLKYYSDISYHLTGSAGHRAVATFHPWDFNPRGSHFEKLIRVRNQNGNQVHEVVDWNGEFENTNQDSMTVLRPEYTEGWDLLGLKTFLDLLEDIDRAVTELSANKILELRSKRVTRDFRRKMCEMVTTLGSKESGRGTAYDLWETEGEFRTELKNALEEELDADSRRHKRAQSIFTNDISWGGAANLASATGVNVVAEAILGSGDVSMIAGTVGGMYLQNKFSTDIFPNLVETDLHDFEQEYREVVG